MCLETVSTKMLTAKGESRAGDVAQLVEFFPSVHEAPAYIKPVMVEHAYNSRKQEDLQFKVTLSSTVSLGPAWAT